MSAATATDLAATLRLLSETTTPGEWVVEDAEEASGDMRALLVGTDDGGPVEIAYVHMDEPFNAEFMAWAHNNASAVATALERGAAAERFCVLTRANWQVHGSRMAGNELVAALAAYDALTEGKPTDG